MNLVITWHAEKGAESMLDKKDLEAIGNLLDKRLRQSENLVLEEMGRTRGILEEQINQVKNNLEEIRQYYRIQKLENDNTALLLKMITELTKRVEELERKSA